jgi:signal transduction histidine kinase
LQVLATRIPTDVRGSEIVGAMVERIDALADRVSDILMLAAAREARLQPVRLGPILADAASSAAAFVREVPMPLVTADDPTLTADPQMLRELLLNLLMNACQASRGHTAEPVQAAVTTVDGWCQIEIGDRGPGIEPGIRDRVFEPFFTTKSGGTGLGLAIVKRLVDLQGGTVALADRDGGGTRVRVTLPLHRDRPPSGMR